jgi:hypothetical protein
MSSSPPTSAGEPRSQVPGSAVHVVRPLVPGFERAPARRRPLPDAGAVRLVVVPESAPPYDDGSAGACPQPGPPPCPAGAKPAGPSGAPTTAGPARSGDEPQRGSPAGPQRPGAAWPSKFAQVLAETLAGSRPQGQIKPWTNDRARRLIRQLGPMLATGTAPRVHRVVATRPAPGVVEMTVLVGCDRRVRALAVRLERQEPRFATPGRAATAGRWVCTAIEAA